VIVGLKKAPHDLAYHQEKVFEIDTHMGIVISGMTADARIISKLMRNACLNYEYVYGTKQPGQRLVETIAKKAQVKTCSPAKRPFGVGLLIAAVDQTGTHLYETCPSGNFFEYKAMAIGDKCQSAKTYLERNFEGFGACGAAELVAHGLKALKASAQETELTEHNVSVGVCGKGEDFKMLSAEDLKTALAQIAGADENMDN
jgi:20S proteasome subunit alpha 6